MSSIFPQGGVNASAAPGSITGLTIGPDGDLASGCPDLWYRLSCNNEFDPVAANALLAEAIRIMQDRGHQYDCGRNDNLSQAIGPHLIAYDYTVNLPTDPWPVKNNDDVVKQGSFTVPNSSGKDIFVLATAQLTTLIRTLGPGATENLDVDLKLSNDSSYAGNLLYASINMRRSGSTNFDSWQTTKIQTLNIPAGGRTFFYQLTTTATAAGSFELKEDQAGTKWKFYGLSHLTSDIVAEQG